MTRVRAWLAWVLWWLQLTRRVRLYLLSFACRCDRTFAQVVPIEVHVGSQVLWVNLGVAWLLLGYFVPFSVSFYFLLLFSLVLTWALTLAPVHAVF